MAAGSGGKWRYAQKLIKTSRFTLQNKVAGFGGFWRYEFCIFLWYENNLFVPRRADNVCVCTSMAGFGGKWREVAGNGGKWRYGGGYGGGGPGGPCGPQLQRAGVVKNPKVGPKATNLTRTVILGARKVTH